MKAFLDNYRQSPRKVRLVADIVRGKSANTAVEILKTVPKRAAGPLCKLLASAIANAKNIGVTGENLFVKDLRVSSGVTMKRMMPRARGSAYQIKKRTSRVSLVLEERATEAQKAGKTKA